VENKPASSLLVSLGKALRWDASIRLCGKHVVTGGRLTRRPEKCHFSARASAEKFPGELTEKIMENSKTDRKIALFKPLPGGGTKKRPKIAKKQKQNIALLSLALSTISVSCMKIQEGGARPRC